MTMAVLVIMLYWIISGRSPSGQGSGLAPGAGFRSRSEPRRRRAARGRRRQREHRPGVQSLLSGPRACSMQVRGPASQGRSRHVLAVAHSVAARRACSRPGSGGPVSARTDGRTAVLQGIAQRGVGGSIRARHAPRRAADGSASTGTAGAKRRSSPRHRARRLERAPNNEAPEASAELPPSNPRLARRARGSSREPGPVQTGPAASGTEAPRGQRTGMFGITSNTLVRSISEFIRAGRRRFRAGTRSCGPGPPAYDYRGRCTPSHRLGRIHPYVRSCSATGTSSEHWNSVTGGPETVPDG